MNQDNEIIREVREIRHQIAVACGNDLRKITEHANKTYEEFLARSRRTVES